MTKEDKVQAAITVIYLVVAVVTYFTFPWDNKLAHPTCVGEWLLFLAVKIIGSLIWPIIWFCNVMTWKI